ncbi:hypothetical protein THOM_2179 [Trachipleistophora hominis]|uniref:Uncharacterized protein n=1 Tax=Trachipleistophora hominis TaxID=72359 RepID=L7JVU7_TRAHO|nr:hypothetical protein THOM_2179 [Trachipleistophora hominis]
MSSFDEKLKILTANNVPESSSEYITTLATLRQQSKLADITLGQNLEELIKYAMHAHPFIGKQRTMIPEQCHLCGTSSHTLYRMCQHPLDIPCAIKLYVTNGKKCPFCDKGLFIFLGND